MVLKPTAKDMGSDMKVHQIKIRWLVYPPNYKPGDGYYERRFLKHARVKAKELGVGSQIWQVKEVTTKDWSGTQFGLVKYFLEN